MKMEVKRLLDETDQLQADKEEANKLTVVAQKHKLAYKKELEQMRNAEHLQQLNSMLFGLQASNDDDTQALKQLESSFISDSNDFGKMPPKGSDLFSEIHGDMHGRISELEAKNDQLSLNLKDAERDISFVVPVLKKLE
ncbi:unnamed protein product, partial [Anisakis simplex]|uniref:HOOK domain-containing protein n=1 Tax=Anisakis simplex TaxID=6269 RepID=A0A0M3KJL2_ANISI